jgi:hypothetical protein
MRTGKAGYIANQKPGCGVTIHDGHVVLNGNHDKGEEKRTLEQPNWPPKDRHRQITLEVHPPHDILDQSFPCILGETGSIVPKKSRDSSAVEQPIRNSIPPFSTIWSHLLASAQITAQERFTR